MVNFNLIFSFCVLLLINESLQISVDVTVPHKCPLLDGECKKKLYESVFRKVAVNGEPSLNIPVMDPLVLSDVANTLPNDVHIVFVNGTVEGLRNCAYDHLKSRFNEVPSHTDVDITCYLEIEGDYKVSFPNKVLIELGGEDMHVDVISITGKGKILMDSFEMKITIPITLSAPDKDGNIFFEVGDFKLIHDVPAFTSFTHLEFHVDSIINNEKIVKYLKDHSSELFPVAVVMDNIQIYYHRLLNEYLSKIPLKDFITLPDQ